MAQESMEILSEKTHSFLTLVKQMEEWAAILPHPKAMKLFKDGKEILEQARTNLDGMLELLNSVPNVEDEGPRTLSGELLEDNQNQIPEKSLKQDETQKVSPKQDQNHSSKEPPEPDPVEKPKPSSTFKWNPELEFIPRWHRVIILPEYPTNAVRLTPLVPIFYGNSRSWMVFKEAFNIAVHDCAHLSVGEKVISLTAYLAGDARDLVSDIPWTEENYDVIWNLLVKTYEHPFKKIFRYDFSPRIHPRSYLESFYYLQEVLDYCFMVYITLRLNNSQHLVDNIVYYIMQLRLDPDLFRHLIKHLMGDQKPTFEQMSGFLQYHIQKMSRINPEKRNLQMQGPRYGRQQGLVMTTLNPNMCKLCGQASHKLFNCKGFLQLDPFNRYAYVRTNHRCFNCLGERHSVTMCLSENVCAVCKKRHHSLLHEEAFELEEQHQVRLYSHGGENYKPQFSPISMITSNNGVMATGALTAHENNFAFGIPVRALLDSTTQCHSISERCRALLNLPLSPLDSALTSFEDIQRGVVGSTVIRYSPHFNYQHVMQIIAYVINNLSFNIPPVPIPPHIKGGLIRFELTDPKFDTPSSIDILIGSEIFPTILRGNQYRVPHSFCYAIETVLGWVLMGNAPLTGPVDPVCCVNAVKHTLRRLHDIREYFYPEIIEDSIEDDENEVEENKEFEILEEKAEVKRESEEKEEPEATKESEVKEKPEEPERKKEPEVMDEFEEGEDLQLFELKKPELKEEPVGKSRRLKKSKKVRTNTKWRKL